MEITKDTIAMFRLKVLAEGENFVVLNSGDGEYLVEVTIWKEEEELEEDV